MVKTKLLLLFTSLESNSGPFGVQTSDGEYDWSGLSFSSMFVPGNRHFPKLHFNPFFICFYYVLDFWANHFEILGLAPLARVSGTNLRQWTFLHKEVAPMAQRNFPLKILKMWAIYVDFQMFQRSNNVFFIVLMQI